MAALSTQLRNQLERAVKNARDIAEQGARAAIEQLAVHEYEPYRHLTPDQRELRNRLRARARQLGDTRDQTGRHGIGHLVVETAYEHWHRMLFARFLAENNLLMHPEGMPVTLEECDELAPDEGAADGWELASWYAAKMLPQIFRPGSPVFELKLPRERVQKLERLLDDLPPPVFRASDSLGWVYQFWQAKKKDEVNASEVKIGADEISAVTQLFTEPYMVDFLLQNTLGAWWVGRHGKDSLPLEMPYLRFLDDGTPAAGTFDEWPKIAAALKMLDPCCGSGHFLVATFEILVRFRLAEEKLSPAAACDAVLRDNLHGLEIDERCTQIAAFALALAAWKFEGAGGYRVLPDVHIACSGLSPRAMKSDWLALAGDDPRLRNGMGRLYELFQDAPVLGSLLDPTTVGLAGDQREFGVAQFDELRPLLDAELDRGESTRDTQRHELSVTAKGIATAAQTLGQTFTLVVTNVPFLTKSKHGAVLKRFCEDNFGDAKTDLATVFAARMVRSLTLGGTIGFVSPQNWLFLTSYTSLRKKWLAQLSWNCVARLGAAAFQDMNWWAAKTQIAILSSIQPKPEHQFCGFDISHSNQAREKPRLLREAQPHSVTQRGQLRNPDHRFTLSDPPEGELLSVYGEALQGVSPADLRRYGRAFWEFGEVGPPWRFWQSTVKETVHYGGRELVLRMGPELQQAVDAGSAYIRGESGWGKLGVVISAMRHLPATLYTGEASDTNVAIIVPFDPDHVPAIWAYCSSPTYHDDVRRIDQALKVTNASLAKVPFDLDHWRIKASAEYPEGLPAPYSEDPTQWIFKGSPCRSGTPLQVAIARLLGYVWPEQADDRLEDLIDDDGIVCLPALRGELPASTRLQTLLAQAYGDDWSPHVLTRLLEDADCKGWSIDRWLADKFFEQHCKLFESRPFIWHIWDGLKDGFSALVNYHQLDRPLLETLTYNYLGDWIRQQQAGGEGSEERLAAAEALQAKLKLILAGEAPHDIFVRWKTLAEQPIGWAPDLNDGVRMNIRPFMTVPDVGKKGAGILRAKPSIKWGKDRGKDPGDAPWYDLGPEYGGKPGDRINDHHLTLAEKQAARRGGA